MPFQKGHQINVGRNCSQGEKRKISQSMMGKKNALGHRQSEEHKRKRSQSLMGNKNHLGFKHSEETKQKMSEARKGPKHSQWKGGQYKSSEGRIMVVASEHPFTHKNGYILRSHLVLEKILGRYLKREEIVHHINEIVDDDSPDNLQLFPNQDAHTKFHNLMR